MSSEQLRMGGVISLIVCAVCLFAAVERCQSNAANVQAIKAMSGSSSMGGMLTGLEPTTPAAAKYAMFFGLISGVAGAVMIAKSRDNA